MKFGKILAISTFLLAGITKAFAVNVNGVIGVGYDIGGETLLTVEFDKGNSEKIKSHQGLFINGGIDVGIYQNIFLRTTIGYKFDTVTASNGSASFNRVPLEILLFNEISEHRIGAGFTYHTLTKLSCEIDNVCNENIDVKNSLGWLIQYEYAFSLSNSTRKTTVGARYTSIDYTPKHGGETINAKGFGLVVGFIF